MRPIPIDSTGGSLSPGIAQSVGFGAMLAFGLFSVAVPGLFLVIFLCQILIFLVKLLPDDQTQRLHSRQILVANQRRTYRGNPHNRQRQ